MVLLAAARALVAAVPFKHWRALLGRPAVPVPANRGKVPAEDERRLVKAVERAALRLPGESRCLSQAMALQWLLRRRRCGGVLYIGVLPGANRGGLDDLHAWVALGDTILIGAGESAHHPLLAASNPPRRRRRGAVD